MSETSTARADLHRFFVSIELDRRRVIIFDNAATWLIYRQYGSGFLRKLYERVGEGADTRLRIISLEALEFFLWAGLQADAKAAGESLTLAEVAGFILPTTIEDIVQGLLIALAATRRPPKNG